TAFWCLNQAASSRAVPSTNSSNSVGSSPSLPAANSWRLGPQKSAASARPANRQKRSERADRRSGKQPVRHKTSQPRDDPCSGFPPPPGSSRARYQLAMLTTKRKIALARVLNCAIVGTRALAGRPSRVIVRRRQVAWDLDLNEGIDLAIYLGLYQRIPRRAARWIAPGALVLDIGANIGAHSLPLARAVGPAGRVIAIAPGDYAFARLKANAAAKPKLWPQLVPTKGGLPAAAAAPANEETVRFYSRWPLRGSGSDRHSKHLGAPEAAVAARFLTLDTLLQELRHGNAIEHPVA